MTTKVMTLIPHNNPKKKIKEENKEQEQVPIKERKKQEGIERTEGNKEANALNPIKFDPAMLSNTKLDRKMADLISDDALGNKVLVIMSAFKDNRNWLYIISTQNKSILLQLHSGMTLWSDRILNWRRFDSCSCQYALRCVDTYILEVYFVSPLLLIWTLTRYFNQSSSAILKLVK
jgi:hypothetical protein